jgi:hypothetical protein
MKTAIIEASHNLGETLFMTKESFFATT